MKKTVLTLLTLILTLTLTLSAFCISASAEELTRMKRGDLLTELPVATNDGEIRFTDLSRVETGEFSLEWDAVEGAASYSVRLLFNINYMEDDSALNFLYDEEVKTDKTSATVTGLQYQRRYTVLVYALDAEGKDMAVLDSMPVFTYPVTLWEEGTEEPEFDDVKGGVSQTAILIIIASATAVVLIAAVIIVIVVLKKPAKKKE